MAGAACFRDSPDCVMTLQLRAELLLIFTCSRLAMPNLFCSCMSITDTITHSVGFVMSLLLVDLVRFVSEYVLLRAVLYVAKDPRFPMTSQASSNRLQEEACSDERV